MTQPSIAMPSLDAGNRISLPSQPAPYGTPAAEIGPIVHIASDLDRDGFATNPEYGPMPIGRRIGLAIVVSIVAFGFIWFAVMIAVQNPTLATPLAILANALGIAWFWRAAGKTKRQGSCVYIGEHGFTRVEVTGRKQESKTMLFRDDLTTTTKAENVYINGTYRYSIELAAFWLPDGRNAGVLVGTYDVLGRPSAHALATRAVVDVLNKRRLAATRDALARGASLAFPLVDATRGAPRATGPTLVLDAHTLAYFGAPDAQPLRVARTIARLQLREGYVDLIARDTGMVLGTFERAALANYELLAALVA